MVNEIPGFELGYVSREPRGRATPRDFSRDSAQMVHRFHRRLPGYRATRLVRLRQLARSWGVGEILVKDESTRFNLKAFKVLGSSYAMARLLCQKLERPLDNTDFDFLVSTTARRIVGEMTFTTATDGNHGRGVAWMARQLDQQAVVYMPKGTVPSRVDNIRSHGAVVEVTDLNYDDTVRLAGDMARSKGWHLIQDTAWEGYTDIPLWIMQGYMTMCTEAVEQMFAEGVRPTHVFVQAGVGSLAAAVVGHLSNAFSDRLPQFIIMEPKNAACFLASAAAGDGRPRTVSGDLDTIMAGLACGEPNPMAWDILWEFSNAYIRCDNYVSANGIRILANPLAGDEAIESGESGSIGIGLLELIASHPAFNCLKKDLGIGPDANLLFFNTEGATDPNNVRQILWHGKYRLLKNKELNDG